MTLTFQAPKRLSGQIVPPPDKSITHRALMVAGIAEGSSHVHNPLDTGDCISTRRCLESLGVSFAEERDGDSQSSLKIEGRGTRGFQEPADIIDAGNSGTTTRLLAGLLAGQRLFAVLTGDDSVRSRPMLRVVRPLRLMGADIKGRQGGRYLPLVFSSGAGNLQPIEYQLPVPSAQVKSALIFAGLRAEGKVRIGGAIHSRDHTERLFEFLGLPLAREGQWLIVEPIDRISPFELTVPGDISSAAFFITAALICGQELRVDRCGLNPSRLGFIEVIRRMGARLELEEGEPTGGEPWGALHVLPGPLQGTEVTPDEIPSLIDEIPLLAVLGAFAEGTTRVRGAGELRHKESDRLAAVANLLGSVGGAVELTEDGFFLDGPQALRSGLVDPAGDHRIAMAAAVLGAGVRDGVAVSGFEAAQVSFPDFVGVYRSLGGEVS